eukprot:scaffold4807_cov222-Chaetoceros_neogracile.AAC.4
MTVFDSHKDLLFPSRLTGLGQTNFGVKLQEYLDEHFCQNWCAFRRIMNPSINDSLFHDAIYKRRNIIKIFDLDWGASADDRASNGDNSDSSQRVFWGTSSLCLFLLGEA